MNRLNDFLNRARETGKLIITPVRTRGVTPNTEVFARKLANVVHDVSPDVSVVSLTPKTVEAGAKSSLVTWAAAVATAIRGRRALDGFGEDLLDAFSNLHAVALAEYAEAMDSAPTQGRGLAGGISSLSGGGTYGKAADAVFEASFADAHALMSFAKQAGAKRALEMAAAVTSHRRAGGDFDRFSMYAQSTDTEAAIRIVANELRGGAVYGKLGNDDLTAHAMAVAAQGVGLWMQKNGAPNHLGQALGDVIASVGEGLRLAAAAPRVEQRPRPGMAC